MALDKLFVLAKVIDDVAKPGLEIFPGCAEKLFPCYDSQLLVPVGMSDSLGLFNTLKAA